MRQVLSALKEAELSGMDLMAGRSSKDKCYYA